MRRVVVGPWEHEVLGHHDVECVAGPDLDRGGDTHATADQFRRDLAQLLPHGSARHVAGGGPTEAPAEIRDLAQLHAGTDDREEEGAAEHAEQVVVHLVLEASGPGRVRAGHAVLQAQTRRVREDHALPRDEDALLAVDRPMVVETDQPCTLRDQEMLAGLGVEDRLADLRDQLPWEIRVDPRQKHRGNDGPRLHLVGARRLAGARAGNLGAGYRWRGWTGRPPPARAGRPGRPPGPRPAQ